MNEFQNAGKTVPFLNMDTLRRDVPRYRSNSLYMFYWIAVRKSYAKFTVMHLHRSLFSTCYLQLYWKRDVGIYIFLWILRKFLGATLLLKNSSDLVLKGQFYKKWRTSILIIKRYRKVDSTFKEHGLWGKKYIWQPLFESW